jgi:hypothetical protein
MVKNGFARKLSALAASSVLTLAFWAASVRPLRGQNLARDSSAATQTTPSGAQPGHTYWKHPDYDAVLDLWNCPERGVCLKIHSLNPADKKVRELAAKELKKKPEELTDADMVKFCGYEFQLQEMKQKKDGKWQGKLAFNSYSTRFGVEIQRPAEDGGKLRMRGYIAEGFWHKITLGNPGGLLGKTIEFTPVTSPPPSCQDGLKPPSP